MTTFAQLRDALEKLAKTSAMRAGCDTSVAGNLLKDIGHVSSAVALPIDCYDAVIRAAGLVLKPATPNPYTLLLNKVRFCTKAALAILDTDPVIKTFWKTQADGTVESAGLSHDTLDAGRRLARSYIHWVLDDVARRSTSAVECGPVLSYIVHNNLREAHITLNCDDYNESHRREAVRLLKRALPELDALVIANAEARLRTADFTAAIRKDRAT